MDDARKLLIGLGEALYGRNWKMPLARELHYSERTVRRWAKGEMPIPKGVKEHLQRIAYDRMVERLDDIRKLEGLNL